MFLALGISTTWFDLIALLFLILLKYAVLKVYSSWHLEHDAKVLLLWAKLSGAH